MSLPKFGVQRPVPVNILMWVLIVAGLYAAGTMTREFFPDSTPGSCTITLVYPGATPVEVEETLARKCEDAIAGLEDIERVTTTVSENGGGMVVEFRDGVDVLEATREVEREIDALQDLPDEAEEIIVSAFDPVLPLIMINVFGEAPEEEMKRVARSIRDDLRSMPDMGNIAISGLRDYEIRIDCSQASLIEHGLALPVVSDAVTRWMADVPGGTVRTELGNINVRLMGAEERTGEIRDIVVAADADGRMITVGDVATVSEFYVDEDFATRFATRDAGGPSVGLTVYKTGDQDAVSMARMVRAYVSGRLAAAGLAGGEYEPELGDRFLGLINGMRSAGAESSGRTPPEPLMTPRRRAYELGLNAAVPIPPGSRIAANSDLARFIEGRLELLVRNARAGAILVVGTLLLFLNWRTAFWVGVGLSTALCGTLIFMQITGTTLNLLTMFGLIVVLGLLVDDAIVVAENIQARHDRGEPALSAAVTGTEQVFWPVVATILTSIVAFMPLTFIKGQIGDLMGALPWVVACALVMSLIESVLILPSHMGHSLVQRDRREPGPVGRFLMGFEKARDRVIFDIIVPAYARLLALVLHFRYVSFATATAALIISLGLVAGGRPQFEFLPSSDSETIIINIRMPVGSAMQTTADVVQRFESVARAQLETTSVGTLIGVQANIEDASGVTTAGTGTHLAQIFVELLPTESRERESQSVIQSIREGVGMVAGVERIEYKEIQGGPSGKDITVEVSSKNDDSRLAVADEIRALLESIDGVYDVADDETRGQREVRMHLDKSAAALGLTASGVARQVRGALFGLEAHVFAEREEDIKVRVRLDEASRRSLHAIENLWVMTPKGEAVPLREVATLDETDSYKAIRRVDRRRTTSVSADTAPDVSPETVVPAMAEDLATLRTRFPDVRIEFAGRQREMRKAFESMPVGFALAVALIYVILAWLFSSYFQPLAVMLAIPFGLIGVVWGHVILGFNLTIMSMIGFVALSGIVVNDSLILVEFYNARRRAGEPLLPALIEAGRQRLRPIMLTTITTVLGLTPLMLEQSFQAKFLIPMAIAIAFGLISATALILLVLPCIIVIFDDIRRAGVWLWRGRIEE